MECNSKPLVDQPWKSLLHLFKLPFFLLLLIAAEAYITIKRWQPVFQLLPVLCILIYLAIQHYLSRPLPVYLLDFSCLRPPRHHRIPTSAFLEHATLLNYFDKDSLEFMSKIITLSGQGEETYLPTPLHYFPPKTGLRDSIGEAHSLFFPVIDDLFSKTRVTPRDVDVLIVNCSGFCPSPSLSSIIVNRYAMRDDIKSFNLSGMGCSAGTIGIDVARTLLRKRENSYAVIVSTEILSTGWYAGKDKRKLLLNCLFRMGCSAVMLTNKREEKSSSKYRLVKLLRTQRAFDDKAYRSAIREEDSEGITGFTLERGLLQVAADTLRDNVFGLGLSVLPLREKIVYGFHMLVSKLFKKGDQYVPDFSSSIQHYCLPASGMAVVREIGKGLKMRKEEMEAALMTFQRFGNQSSSSMWYQMAYMEAKRKVKEGDKVCQLAMGSGPKCNSVVWESLRDSSLDEAKKGPWFDCIGRYPLNDD
ncbi:3-ketoacyl-CoA synthase 4 [Acorus gramineus]|uniref:3-ketoacyl-CoA synthase n=1 Tax=Acorus gramineus TaxID=55184 RepID=A0AAV9ADM2_ACOGR|nr:3-ketoacyl-CoA synthase 4 [Acorus gramineus]